METMRIIDRALYVAISGPSWDKPETVTNYYPVIRRLSAWQIEAWQVYDGQWVRIMSGGKVIANDGTVFEMVDGGETKPAFTETEPIAKPKGRKPWVWENGGWVKDWRKD
jgi:hypothetical protein